MAATIEDLSYSASTGALAFRIVNGTGKRIDEARLGPRLFFTDRKWPGGVTGEGARLELAQIESRVEHDARGALYQLVVVLQGKLDTVFREP